MDNGCFTDVWTEEKWLAALERNVHAVDRCAFACAPDVVHRVFNEEGEMIRALGSGNAIAERSA